MTSWLRRGIVAVFFLTFRLYGANIWYYSIATLCESVDGCSPIDKNNNGNTATVSAVADTLPSDIYRHEQVSATADLLTGELHAWSQGYVLATAVDGTSFTTFSQAFIADTFTASGKGLDGGRLYTTLNVGGNFDVQLPLGATSTYTNWSYVEVYFDPVGSLDGGPYTPYAAYFWGLGPNASDAHPPNATYMGNFGSSQTIDIPFNLIGNNMFQMAIGLGADITGNSIGGISWNLDYSHTLTVSLSTSPDVTLSSIGGMAGTAITPASAAPEPGSAALLMGGIGLGALAWRRRRA